MIILRESSIDATYTTIEEFATSMWNSKNIMHDSNGKLEVNIKSKIKTVDNYNAKIKPIEDLIIKSILDFDLQLIRFLDKAKFQLKSKHIPHLEYISEQFKNNEVNVSDKNILDILINHEELFNRTLSDFKYSVFILDVLNDKNKAKNYFKNISDINIKLIMPSNKVLSATEIYTIVDDLTRKFGKDSGKVSNKKFTITQFLNQQNISGDTILMLQYLFKYLNMYSNSIKNNIINIGDYSEAFLTMIQVIKNNDEDKTKSKKIIDFVKNILHDSYITDIQDARKCIQEFHHLY